MTPRHLGYSRPFLSSYAVILLCFLPQIAFIINQASSKIHESEGYLRIADPVSFGLSFLKVASNPVKLSNDLLDWGLKYFVGAFIITGIVLGWKKHRDAITYNLSLIFFGLLFSWICSFFIFISGTFRHVIFLNAPFLLLLAMSVVVVADKLALNAGKLDGDAFLKQLLKVKNAKKNVVLIIASIWCLIDIYVLVNYYRSPRTADWRSGTTFLKNCWHEDETIVPIPGYAAHIIDYYFSEEKINERVLWIFRIEFEQMQSLATDDRGVYFITDGHLSDCEYKVMLSRFQTLGATKIWEDKNFHRSAIWHISGISSRSAK